jgi:hypothetical protein
MSHTAKTTAFKTGRNDRIGFTHGMQGQRTRVRSWITVKVSARPRAPSEGGPETQVPSEPVLRHVLFAEMPSGQNSFAFSNISQAINWAGSQCDRDVTM